MGRLKIHRSSICTTGVTHHRWIATCRHGAAPADRGPAPLYRAVSHVMMLHPIRTRRTTMLFPASAACARSGYLYLRYSGPLHLRQEPKETPNRPE
jgi:hypothetical protein